MARPLKYTVDYFSHDANASGGKTLSIIFNRFGHEGISCWWQLLEYISSVNKHVIGIGNPEDLEFLGAKLRLPPERLNEILSKLAELGAIDRALFECGLIWSDNFVARLEPVYKARKQVLPSKPLLPVPETRIPGKKTPFSIPVMPQTIGTKESKRYGQFNNVLLSDKEYDGLGDRFGDTRAEKIEELSEALASKSKKYRQYTSHYATILSWDRRDRKNRPPSRPRQDYEDVTGGAR